MSGTERVRDRLEGVRDLGGIVRAMKALSAVRIRQAREAVASLDGYKVNVERALQVALSRRPGSAALPEPESGGGLVIVLFGSDLGLLGHFNARIVEYALEALPELARASGGPTAALTVGGRVVGELESRGGPPILRRFPAPGTVDAVVPTVQDVAVALDEIRSERDADRIVLFYNHYHSGATYRPSRIQLLPLHPEWLAGLEGRPWSGASIPTYRIPWRRLFSAAVQEYIFVSLFGAATESHAAEHAARLSSMETAEERIEEREAELTALYQRTRKQRITEELLDLIVGFTALEEEGAEAEGE